MSIYEELKELLKKSVSSSKAEYFCTYIDETCIIFSPTTKTGKVMIPTSLVVQYIQALDSGTLNLDMSARDIRQVMTQRSEWAPYQHGYETHVFAILKAWANR